MSIPSVSSTLTGSGNTFVEDVRLVGDRVYVTAHEGRGRHNYVVKVRTDDNERAEYVYTTEGGEGKRQFYVEPADPAARVRVMITVNLMVAYNAVITTGGLLDQLPG